MDDVVACFAVNKVVIGPALYFVLAVAPIDLIIANFAEDLVVSPTTVNLIVTGPRMNRVVSETRGDDVSTLLSVNSVITEATICLLYTSPSPRDQRGTRMPSSA